MVMLKRFQKIHVNTIAPPVRNGIKAVKAAKNAVTRLHQNTDLAVAAQVTAKDALPDVTKHFKSKYFKGNRKW
jgi:hypothetical protein